MQQQEGGAANKDTKKALAKALKKKEKAEKKAQENYQREVRKAREEQRMEEERKRDEERAKKRQEEEEKARVLEEERLRQEEEEYKKWEQFITVEDEGIGAKEDIFENPQRLDNFIQYLTSHKKVLETVSRLEEENRLTVIVDDRGKLIVITEEELQSVTDLIKKNGRISLNKLTKLCGFIRMQGSEELHPSLHNYKPITTAVMLSRESLFTASSTIR
ncbi:hypothetical protein JH06_1041 [Blastocystis sp. subtype 4]|uniref:hypothetical protein n=1 Tax=Blastocystis sp. subtype 4 TaxID=944170 RepID=UPI000711AE65|nr:hypothetical protein JH06_1041 [Blastocystis sp. subtype 4]KNB45332.1 hypothetical protein JH06_1041 [Blastocystis sp. subtype 4]|eukprot:XP_014528775.1 hypothetical protein JH06_1041 [Blastocystis sp. subtype 4]